MTVSRQDADRHGSLKPLRATITYTTQTVTFQRMHCRFHHRGRYTQFHLFGFTLFDPTGMGFKDREHHLIMGDLLMFEKMPPDLVLQYHRLVVAPTPSSSIKMHMVNNAIDVLSVMRVVAAKPIRL
ncbi:MAG: hypothetical protein OXC80_13720 [Gammaproteobacteria bacterium]|nr:hypothetical protein [Gammaproteobacteria bacterium]